MSTILEIHEPKLEFIISHKCREFLIPIALQKLIIQYINSIRRKLQKTNFGSKFQIQILTPAKKKSNCSLYDTIEYKFTNLYKHKKFCIGISSTKGERTRRNKIKKLQNKRTFWGIFICDNKIFIKEQGVIHSISHRTIQSKDIILVENNLLNGHWRITLQRKNLIDIVLFNFIWKHLNTYQLGICLFNDQDTIRMLEIHAYKSEIHANNNSPRNNNSNLFFKTEII